jgi:hypothetical protein
MFCPVDEYFAILGLRVNTKFSDDPKCFRFCRFARALDEALCFIFGSLLGNVD